MAGQFVRWLQSQNADAEPVRVSRDTLERAGMPRWLILTWTAHLKQLERQGAIRVLERAAPRGGGQTHSYLVKLGKADPGKSAAPTSQNTTVDVPGRFRLIVTVDPQRQPAVAVDVEGIDVPLASASGTESHEEIESLRADLLKLAGNLTNIGQQMDRIATDRAQALQTEMERRFDALADRVAALEQHRRRPAAERSAPERPFLPEPARMFPRPRRQNGKDATTAPEAAQRIAREVFGDPEPARDPD
jgi:hypothetical protein